MEDASPFRTAAFAVSASAPSLVAFARGVSTFARLTRACVADVRPCLKERLRARVMRVSRARYARWTADRVLRIRVFQECDVATSMRRRSNVPTAHRGTWVME